MLFFIFDTQNYQVCRICYLDLTPNSHNLVTRTSVCQLEGGINNQGSVFHRANDTIQGINCYPADNYKKKKNNNKTVVTMLVVCPKTIVGYLWHPCSAVA